MVDQDRRDRGLLDTSVVVDLEAIPPRSLPAEVAISSITLAELAAGPHATTDSDERSRRQDRLQRAEAAFDPLPFNVDAARAYGRVFAAVSNAGGKPRGARAVDLLIAATALAENLPLYTRNPSDFSALENLIEVVALQSRPALREVDHGAGHRAYERDHALAAKVRSALHDVVDAIDAPILN